MSEAPEEWSEADSGMYRDIARYAVPERERQIAIITKLVQATEGNGAVLDLCCGEGLLTKAIMTALPGVSVLAYDGSESMLAQARERVPDPQRLTTRQVDLAANDWRQFERPLRAAVSSLAIHHLDGAQKRRLFAGLHAALAVNGVFVIADLMLPTTRAGANISADLWNEEVRRRALDLDGELKGFEAFERAEWNYYRHPDAQGIDKPSTFVEHLDWLREAGFADVDCHWMVAGHAIISGSRRG